MVFDSRRGSTRRRAPDPSTAGRAGAAHLGCTVIVTPASHGTGRANGAAGAGVRAGPPIELRELRGDPHGTYCQPRPVVHNPSAPRPCCREFSRRSEPGRAPLPYLRDLGSARKVATTTAVHVRAISPAAAVRVLSVLTFSRPVVLQSRTAAWIRRCGETRTRGPSPRGALSRRAGRRHRSARWRPGIPGFDPACGGPRFACRAPPRPDPRTAGQAARTGPEAGGPDGGARPGCAQHPGPQASAPAGQSLHRRWWPGFVNAGQPQARQLERKAVAGPGSDSC